VGMDIEGNVSQQNIYEWILTWVSALILFLLSLLYKYFTHLSPHNTTFVLICSLVFFLHIKANKDVVRLSKFSIPSIYNTHLSGCHIS
jgi:hypothetical protein